jgi:hypothetical protein
MHSIEPTTIPAQFPASATPALKRNKCMATEFVLSYNYPFSSFNFLFYLNVHLRYLLYNAEVTFWIELKGNYLGAQGGSLSPYTAS